MVLNIYLLSLAIVQANRGNTIWTSGASDVADTCSATTPTVPILVVRSWLTVCGSLLRFPFLVEKTMMGTPCPLTSESSSYELVQEWASSEVGILWVPFLLRLVLHRGVWIAEGGSGEGIQSLKGCWEHWTWWRLDKEFRKERNERRLTWSFDSPSLILFMARLSRSWYVPPPGVSFSGAVLAAAPNADSSPANPPRRAASQTAFSLSFSSSSSDIAFRIRPFTNSLANSSPNLLSSTSESSDVLASFEAEDSGREGGRVSTRVLCQVGRCWGIGGCSRLVEGLGL